MEEAVQKMLLKIPIFSRFPRGDLEALAAAVEVRHVAAGTSLFHEGDPGTYACFIVDGRLDVLKKTVGGQPVVLNTLSRGQCIGEMAIIERMPRSATVRADTDALLVTLTREAFEGILNDQHPAAVRLLKGIALLLSRKLRLTTTRLVGDSLRGR